MRRSPVAEELELLQKEREIGRSAERRRLARLVVARKAREMQKAKEAVEKLLTLQRRGQRKAQRDLVETHRQTPPDNRSSVMVPYVPVTQVITNATLYKPSFARSRMRRRQQKQLVGGEAVDIPSGGQAL